MICHQAIYFFKIKDLLPSYHVSISIDGNTSFLLKPRCRLVSYTLYYTCDILRSIPLKYHHPYLYCLYFFSHYCTKHTFDVNKKQKYSHTLGIFISAQLIIGLNTCRMWMPVSKWIRWKIQLVAAPAQGTVLMAHRRLTFRVVKRQVNDCYRGKMVAPIQSMSSKLFRETT